MHRFSEFLIGLLFGWGLLISGMTDPGKVLGFLDLAGAWDPSLAFVMGGGVLVGLVALLWPRNAPPVSWARPCTCPPHATSTGVWCWGP